jgi:hypothetical protein
MAGSLLTNAYLDTGFYGVYPSLPDIFRDFDAAKTRTFITKSTV